MARFEAAEEVDLRRGGGGGGPDEVAELAGKKREKGEGDGDGLEGGHGGCWREGEGAVRR